MKVVEFKKVREPTTELKSVHWILEVLIFSVCAGQKLAYLKEVTN